MNSNFIFNNSQKLKIFRLILEHNAFAVLDGHGELDPDYVEDIYDAIDDLIDNLDDEIDKLKTDRSLLSMIESKYGTYINKKVTKDKLNAYQAETIQMIYQARLKEEKFDTACDPFDYLSAIGWNSFEDSSGDEKTILGIGQKTISFHGSRYYY